MLLFRRFLVLIALSFWQGGFTFYAGVVVPVGQEVFGDLRQGFLTRQVTVYMNIAGAVVLLLLIWDLLAARDPSRRRQWGRYLLWAVMVLALVGLGLLHGRLDELLVRKGFLNRDPELFRPRHRLYLWISTVQWACGLLYLFLTLITWRKEDLAGLHRAEVKD